MIASRPVMRQFVCIWNLQQRIENFELRSRNAWAYQTQAASVACVPERSVDGPRWHGGACIQKVDTIDSLSAFTGGLTEPDGGGANGDLMQVSIEMFGFQTLK